MGHRTVINNRMLEEPEFSDDSNIGEPVVSEEQDDEVIESDDLNDEEDDDENNTSTKVKKRTRQTQKKQKRTSKRFRVSARNFMDVEAAVGNDDDDDDEDEEDDTYFHEADEAQLAERELDLAQRRRLNQSFSTAEARGAAGHLASAIGNLERRYQDQHYDEHVGVEDAEEEDDEDEEEEEGYQLLPYGDYEGRGEDPTRFLADAKDSKLWVVRTTRSVSEREVVISVMNKYVHMRQKKKPFPILSAFAPDGIRGHIYVEAENLAQIRDALRGLRSVILTSIRMVPLKEMNSVYTMGDKEIKVLTRNELVRVKGGLYAGDLGQVSDVEEQMGTVWIRLIPRINLGELFDRKPSEKTQIQQKRPVARFITRDEIEAKGGIVEPGPTRGTFKFDGKLYEDTGYLLRKMRPQLLLTGGDVQASVQELKELGRGTDIGDNEGGWQRLLFVQQPSLQKGIYQSGDMIIVKQGDLTGLKGIITHIEERTLTVKPMDKTLHNTISFNIMDIIKYFEIGDSVKAIFGTNLGCSGLITSVDLSLGTAIVFSPALSRPFHCSLDHLQACPNSGTGSGAISSCGGYTVGDLVQLCEQQTSLIIHIDACKTLTVLLTDGKIEQILLSRIATKRSNDFAVALDRQHIQFGIKAAVSLLDSPHKGLTGRVCHIWKRHVFIKLASKDLGHYGYTVCDSQDLKVSPADGGTPTTLTLSHPTTPSSSFGNHRNSGSMGHRGHGRGGGRQWNGQRVRVITGRNKGSFGDVLTYESGGQLRVRLLQNGLTVSLGKDELILLGTGNGRGRGDNKRRGGFNSNRGKGGGGQGWTDYFQSIREGDKRNDSSKSDDPSSYDTNLAPWKK